MSHDGFLRSHVFVEKRLFLRVIRVFRVPIEQLQNSRRGLASSNQRTQQSRQLAASLGVGRGYIGDSPLQVSQEIGMLVAVLRRQAIASTIMQDRPQLVVHPDDGSRRHAGHGRQRELCRRDAPGDHRLRGVVSEGHRK